MTNKETIALTAARPGRRLRIVEILPGREAGRRLRALGLAPGDLVFCLPHPAWGPILVRHLAHPASKIAIGRGLAGRILVFDEDD